MSTSTPRIFINDNKPLDHSELLSITERFASRYSSLGISYLGESILGKKIPLFTIGNGKKEVLYIGAHHGMEWITSVILLRFVNEFCELLLNGKSIYRTSLDVLCEEYTFFILPMLNPDGVEYQIRGVDENNPLHDRLIAMNGGSNDFSHWQANARGVDLNHNYDAGYQTYKEIEAENGILEGAPTRYSGLSPESEPEVAYLCNFIRFHENLGLVLTLHTQGEEIFYQFEGKAPAKSNTIARRISALTGYRLNTASQSAAYGGLTDWCVSKLGIPSFTLECGRGVNPLPLNTYFPIYASLREVLFTIPKMI